MPYTTFNYGFQEFWEPYNPSYNIGPGAPAMGDQKVHFDGPNKLIVINNGITELDVQEDIYSGWKEWFEVRDNAKYEQAMTAIGGETITAVQKVGITYFLENGWRIKMWEGNFNLTVNGNLYTREPGESPYVAAEGSYAVSIATSKSNLVDIVLPEIEGSTTITNSDITAISLAVWNTLLTAISQSNTIGTYIKDSLLSTISIADIAGNTAQEVWNVPTSNVTTSNTMGTHVKDKVLTKNQFLALKD